METTDGPETWYESLPAVLKALNDTLHSNLLCQPGPDNQTGERRASLPGCDDNSYMSIHCLREQPIPGYTCSRKVDRRSDPCHVYIKI